MNFSASFDLKNGLPPLGGASKAGSAQFELRIGPFVGDDLTVVLFRGREALNEPFVYEVLVSSALSEDDLHLGAWGLPACLSIHSPSPHEARVIQGLAVDIVATDTPTDELALRRHRYVVKVAPRLWNLRHSQSAQRIFQNQSAVEIACSILRENGIEPHLQLQRADYPALPFEYQDSENDWDFLRRVLAAAGIFFYFKHASGLLDALVPGGAGVAADIGAVAGVAASLGGAAAGAAGFISETESKLGLVTTMVLADRASATERINDTSDDLAGAAIGALAAAVVGAAASAFGVAGSAAGDVAGLLTGQSESLAYDANGQAGYTDKERVYTFGLRHSLRPKQMSLRHWNIKDAKSYDATAKVAPLSVDASLSLAATAPFNRPSAFGLSAAVSVDIDSPSIPTKDASVFEYDRDASLQNAPKEWRSRLAARALTQARADGLTGQGTSDCRRLAPGYRFNLQMHPVDPLNTEYLVTEITSEGFSPEYLPEPTTRDFSCTFRCVPARVDPLPKKPEPKRHFPTAAVVVGPKAGDIHCDRTHRILVRLRWAESSGDEVLAENGPGLCRVHWLERWGGDRYGTQTLPRVGTEVLVEFIEGNEPIAVGQTRSLRNRPAFDSPQDVTKVGIKSRVIPNGAESEISIDDDPDRNKILLRSSGDLVTEVRKDTTVALGGAYDLSVGEGRKELTDGDARFTFKKNVTVGVVGTHHQEINKDRVLVVDGSELSWVGGDAARTVVGRANELTRGEHSATYAADSTARHHGHHAVAVAPGAESEHSSAAFHVDGPVRAYAKGAVEFESDEGFTLRCGDSSITVRKDSITLNATTIALVGKTLHLTASDTATVTAKTASIAASDSVSVSGASKATLAGKSASVVLDSNATVQGSKVSLGSGDAGASSSSPQAKPKKTSTIRLTDGDGHPRKHRRVLLRTGGDGGEEQVLILDEKGQVDVAGDGPFDVCLLDDPEATPQ